MKESECYHHRDLRHLERYKLCSGVIRLKMDEASLDRSHIASVLSELY